MPFLGHPVCLGRYRPMLSPVRLSINPSVRPPVCPSVTRVDQSKAIEDCAIFTIRRPLVFAGWVSSRNSADEFPWAGASNNWRGGETCHFWLYASISRKWWDTTIVSLLAIIASSCICAFDLHQDRWPWMTLNCETSKFSKFSEITLIWEATTAKPTW